jgi:hypothetical protein
MNGPSLRSMVLRQGLRILVKASLASRPSPLVQHIACSNLPFPVADIFFARND